MKKTLFVILFTIGIPFVIVYFAIKWTHSKLFKLKPYRWFCESLSFPYWFKRYARRIKSMSNNQLYLTYLNFEETERWFSKRWYGKRLIRALEDEITKRNPV